MTRGWEISRRPAGPILLLLSITICAVLFSSGCRKDDEQALRRGAEAWDSGDYISAAEEYEQYLQRYPSGQQSLEARFQLANIYYLNLQRYEQARLHYREFIEQDPANPKAYAARERLAGVLADLGRSYEAIAEYENLTPQDPAERRRVRLLIADLYYNQKNYSQALTEYEKVIEHTEFDDLSEQAYLREATIYNARSQYRQALEVYQRLASKTADPESHRRAIYGVAEAHAGLFQFDEAIKALRQIEDESEQNYIAARITELEQKKREAAQARTGVQP
ncbi:MAG TPA: tetratricopeptide repeat protein [Blastocatellia bacterium]|nr:tetratricopeptide repeat protein [Blastocatellia bacterium]